MASEKEPDDAKPPLKSYRVRVCQQVSDIVDCIVPVAATSPDQAAELVQTMIDEGYDFQMEFHSSCDSITGPEIDEVTEVA